jgi:hypothetical protein
LAKINDLNLDYNKNLSRKIVNFSRLFPAFKKKIDKVKLIKNDIYVWGAGTKALMFLCYLRYFSPVTLNRVKFIIDIDKKKTNHYLQIVNKLIISPQEMIKKINLNSTILVVNSNYLKEIKKYCNKRISKKNIKYLTIE